MTRLGYRLATPIIGGIFGALFVAVAVFAPHPRLIWNASASEPIGLYRVMAKGRPVAGDLVAIAPPAHLAGFLAERHYLPVGVPLLKKIAAGSGAHVCRHGAIVTIDNAPRAIARAHDRRGRPLPIWRGCRVVARGELFLLGRATDSMDGRYFGPISAAGLAGHAIPILTRDATGQPLRWRCAPFASVHFAHSNGGFRCR